MKPDAYIPFYGSDFFGATDGLSDVAITAYLRALWHYWHHTHCDGLPDDDEYLRRVCRCPETEWARTRGLLFGGFFTLDSGQWHQKRSREEYRKALTSYLRKCGGASKARNSKAAPADTNPDIKVDINPTLNLQSESESESAKADRERERKGGFPKLQEVVAFGQMRGLTAEQSEAFWHHYESVSWIDAKQRAITNWQSKLMTWKVQDQAKAHEARRSGPADTSSADKVLWSRELERLMEERRRLKDGAGTDAMGTKHYTPQERKRIAELNLKVTDYRKRLGLD